MNCLTEMYSAIVAEVPVKTDHTTTENTELLDALLESKRVSFVPSDVAAIPQYYVLIVRIRYVLFTNIVFCPLYS